MSYDQCRRCKKYRFDPEKCRCKMFMAVVASNWPHPTRTEIPADEWHEVWAADAELAAESFCQHYDCEGGEYSIIKSGSAEVWVREVNGPISKWNIEAEAVPTYYAREKK